MENLEKNGKFGKISCDLTERMKILTSKVVRWDAVFAARSIAVMAALISTLAFQVVKARNSANCRVVHIIRRRTSSGFLKLLSSRTTQAVISTCRRIN